MFVGTPLVKAEQDRTIRVENLTEVVMGGSRLRQAKQRLLERVVRPHRFASTSEGVLAPSVPLVPSDARSARCCFRQTATSRLMPGFQYVAHRPTPCLASRSWATAPALSGH